ncbi:hypothetical protein EGT49_09770 [Companilactobacillus suantsaicola]|uniref:Uncharacterized protein n=1 Tax=Companilactobacillus suantsaicola TaxID=2487723 RepID=A0A4Z0JJB8_9LACO|nr:hypothetical protein EGT49_09770 [Companilactobacillus suantsaicola]
MVTNFIIKYARMAIIEVPARKSTRIFLLLFFEVIVFKNKWIIKNISNSRENICMIIPPCFYSKKVYQIFAKKIVNIEFNFRFAK